jgi:DNA-binding MarR family transcriptional regulator
MLTPGEMKILRAIGERHVVSKGELEKALQGDAAQAIIDTVVKSLLQKEFITTINPVGTKCFAITKSGLQAIGD